MKRQSSFVLTVMCFGFAFLYVCIAGWLMLRQERQRVRDAHLATS